MTPPRTPVLRPRPVSGRALPHGRSCRVRVDAGAVVVEQPGVPPQTRAAPGRTTRALLLDPDASARLLGRGSRFAGALVLLSGDDPVLVVRLQDWLPPADRTPDVLLETSGARALCAGLGLPLEPAEPADLAALDRGALRRAEVRPLPGRVAPGRAASALCLLAVVLGFGAWPLAGSALGALLAASSLLLVLPVVVGTVRGRAQARTAAAADSSGEGLRPLPAGPVPAGLLDSRLVLTPDELVLRRRGWSVWLAGPASGGVVQALVEPEHVRLCDAAGRDHATLQTALWCGDEAARDALVAELERAGLDVQRVPVDTVPAHDTGDLATGTLRLSSLTEPEERGDPDVLAPFLSVAAVLVALGGALLALTWDLVAGSALALVAAALTVLVLREGWRRRRDETRAVRVVAPPSRAVNR